MYEGLCSMELVSDLDSVRETNKSSDGVGFLVG